MENVSTAIVARRESRLLSGNLLSVVLIALALVAPFVLYPVFLMKALCFALFACAFNLLIGYVGLLSFGHAAFFGTAGYLTAHSAKVWGLPPELAILFGTAASSLLGLVFGGLAIRRQGIYFAMVTLALAQMVYFYALQHRSPTARMASRRYRAAPPRDDRSQSAARHVLFRAGRLPRWLLHHPPHHPLAVRPSPEGDPRERAARHLARLQDRSVQLVAFVLSAALAGLAGGTKSIVFQLASLTDVTWQMSGEVVLMTLLGGLGTVLGPVVGAFIVIAMENYLAQFGSWVTIIQGVIFRGLRPHLPPRYRRRDPAPPAQGGWAPVLSRHAQQVAACRCRAAAVRQLGDRPRALSPRRCASLVGNFLSPFGLADAASCLYSRGGACRFIRDVAATADEWHTRQRSSGSAPPRWPAVWRSDGVAQR